MKKLKKLYIAMKLLDTIPRPHQGDPIRMELEKQILKALTDLTEGTHHGDR